MLYDLKRDIRRSREMEYVSEAISHGADDSVKSAFLDGFDADVIGAENDPEIKDLIEAIPEYDDGDDSVVSEVELKHLTESLIETQI